MAFPFCWVRERQWRSEGGQVIVLEMDPAHVRPAVSVQADWHGCKGIIRGVKENGFLLEDHIREEIRNGKPVDIGRQTAGADEMRKQVWTVDQHKAAFANLHPSQAVVAWVGNGTSLATHTSSALSKAACSIWPLRPETSPGVTTHP